MEEEKIQDCPIEFEFKCPKRWQNLTKTDNTNERFCETCSRKVIYCSTIEEVEECSKAGECIAYQHTRNKDEVAMLIGKVVEPRTISLGVIIVILITTILLLLFILK